MLLRLIDGLQLIVLAAILLTGLVWLFSGLQRELVVLVVYANVLGWPTVAILFAVQKVIE